MKNSYTIEGLRLMQETGEINWRPVEGSKIAEFYEGKNVFVTGATGFFGKLLVEKLLRACPEINTVYILIRPKKGEDVYERVDKLYKDQVFGPLAKLYPKFQHKIGIIKGDAVFPDLGMSPSDIDLIKDKINVIFHAAATVRFDEKINVAAAVNVRGTRDLLDIAHQCKNLKSFVYVSTTYANCNREEIDEVFYPPPMTADQLIKWVEETPEETLIKETPKVLKTWPNTYTFTKAVAENAVQNYGEGLPICVVRPAIVIATYKEPLRNWIDNLYGATGVVVGAATGLLKTIHCDPNKTAELVPGDYVINNIIVASYRTAAENVTKIPIYNYVSSVENRHIWSEFMDTIHLWGSEFPTIQSVWYYCLTLNKHYYVHLIYAIFLHYLPALIMDVGLILTRKRPIMLKINRKITKFETVISHFCTNEWKFHNDNTQSLWNYISEADQKMFPFSMKRLDWEDYHKTHILGLKLYMLKDDMSKQDEANAKWRKLYIAHMLVKALFYFIICYAFYSRISALI